MVHLIHQTDQYPAFNSSCTNKWLKESNPPADPNPTGTNKLVIIFIMGKCGGGIPS